MIIQTIWSKLTFHFLWIMVVTYHETHKQCNKLGLSGVPSYAGSTEKHCILISGNDCEGNGRAEFTYSLREAVDTMKTWSDTWLDFSKI